MKKIFTIIIILFSAISIKACVADYTYTNGCVGDTVFFRAADGSAAYSWDYGDTAAGAANISHDVNGYHVYTVPGDYYVTLFVNIGAEWDYRTNLIHIGSNCFKADFSSNCIGNLNVSFSDFSTGAHVGQYWNFGDTASGTNNNSTLAAPQHTFSQAGWYIITYVVDNSIAQDTITRSVYVSATCISARLPNFTAALNCTSDTVIINASYTATPPYVLWNFGDTSSGVANQSTLLQPRHQFSVPGFYIVTLVYSNGTTYDTVTKGIQVADCNVWPGDANGDGEVNGEDIFPMGIYNGNTGAQRSNATQTWTGQVFASWSRSNYAWMYLNDLVDMNLADCNGDGTINASDVQAIQVNYGKHHTLHNNRSAVLFHSPSDPLLAVNTVNNAVTAGNDVLLTITLGDSTVPANYIYGGSFTLLFDPAKVSPGAVVNFSAGWLDSTGNNMITFYHEDYTAGKLELAFVKTNHISQSGYGSIATVTFHSNTNASGLFNIALDGTAKLFNTNQFGGSGGNQQVFKNMYLQGTSVNIANPNGIEVANTSQPVSIYPNPSTGSIFISHPVSTGGILMEVFNSLGERVFNTTLHMAQSVESVQLPYLANGIYLVSVKNISGLSVQTSRITILK